MPSLIDPPLLEQLSPISAKIYLVLISLADTPIPLARAPIDTLTARSRLSRRSCYLALKQLLDLRLIARLPKKFHTPNTYLLLTPQAAAQPVAQATPQPPTAAPRKPQPTAQKSPAPAAKNQNVHPAAPLLITNAAAPTAQPAAPYLAAEEALLRSLFSQLSPVEQSLILARARQVMAETAYLDNPCPPPLNSPECLHVPPTAASERP